MDHCSSCSKAHIGIHCSFCQEVWLNICLHVFFHFCTSVSLLLSPPPLAPSLTLSLSTSGSLTGTLNGMCRTSKRVLPPHTPELQKLPIIFHWLTSTHHHLRRHNKICTSRAEQPQNTIRLSTKEKVIPRLRSPPLLWKIRGCRGWCRLPGVVTNSRAFTQHVVINWWSVLLVCTACGQMW